MEYLIIQLITSIVTLWTAHRYSPFGFLPMFYIVLTILIIVPFFLIYFSVTGTFDFFETLHHSVDDNVTLSFSQSPLPLIYTILGQWVILLGYVTVMLFVRPQKRDGNAGQKFAMLAQGEVRPLKILLFLLSIGTLGYLLVRFSLIPDYPILAYILKGGDNLRDLAFSYGTNNVFYLFKPSIVQQFTRIFLPLIFFFSYILYLNGKKSSIYVAIIGVIMVLLVFGTFKRTPIIYLLVWSFVFIAFQNPQFRSRKIIKYAVISFVCVTAITFSYTQDLNAAVENIVIRIMLGEAKGEYLAYIHYGTTFEFENLTLITDYMQKVVGSSDIMTFSERWKIVTGGTRGFTSIGVLAETFVSFGLFGLVPLFLFGLLMGVFDVFARFSIAPTNRPIIAGLIAVIAFSAIKGLLSQLFTGGAIMLLLVYFLSREIHKLSSRKPRSVPRPGAADHM